MFQDGPLAAAATTAKAAGAVLFSSAGNSNGLLGGNSWNGYESPAYRGVACPGGIPAYTSCFNFGTGGSPDTSYSFTLADQTSFNVALEWDEPWGGVTTDIDILTLVGGVYQSSLSSGNLNTGAFQEPFEDVGFKNTTGAAETVSLIFGNKGTNTPRLKFVFFRTGGISNVTHAVPTSPDFAGHQIYGHNGSADEISMAATFWGDGVNAEGFSSIGPETLYFAPYPSVSAIATTVVHSPDVTASDGVHTTFFGGGNEFFGTSAASPHGGASAALLLNLFPGASYNTIRGTLLSTAAPMSGGSQTVGTGLINMLAAAQALAPKLAVTKTHVGNFQTGDPSDTFTVTVKNNGSAAPTGGLVTVTDDTSSAPGLTVTSMNGTGWICVLATKSCSRSNPLAIGVSYPDITVTVSVAGNANPMETNKITVSGGHSLPANATDSPTIVQPPAITSVATTTFISGQANSFTVTATGIPTPSINRSGTLPTGVNFVDHGDGTGTLSGNPAATSNASYTITFTANNGIGSPAVQTFVLNIHVPPQFTSLGAAAFKVGSPNSFTVTTLGIPTNAITEVGALPAGVSLVDNGNDTATLSGNPAPGSAPSYTFTITATNGVGSPANQSFVLTVNLATDDYQGVRRAGGTGLRLHAGAPDADAEEPQLGSAHRRGLHRLDALRPPGRHAQRPRSHLRPGAGRHARGGLAERRDAGARGHLHHHGDGGRLRPRRPDHQRHQRPDLQRGQPRRAGPGNHHRPAQRQ